MISVIELIFAALSSASMAIVLKCFRKQEGNRYGVLLGNYLTCMLLSFLLLSEKDIILHLDITTVICGIAGGILFVAGLVSMQSSIRINGAILTSAFSKLGLVVPLLISVIFLGESIRALQIPGILMILVSFWLISTDPEAGGNPGTGSAPEAAGNIRVHPLLLLIVLLSCGGGDAMAKLFDHFGQRSRDSLYFLILFTVAAVITLILLLAEQHKTGKKVSVKEFMAGILVGIPNYFSSFLLLKALNGLPAFIVYPCFSAGTLLLVTLAGTAIFHERPGKRTWAGLAIIAASLVLLNL